VLELVLYMQLAVALVFDVAVMLVRRARQSAWFYSAGFVLLFAGCVITLLSEATTSLEQLPHPLAVALAEGVALVVWAPFLIQMVRFVHKRNRMLHADLPKTYARAKRAESERNWFEAIRIYQHYLDEDPDDNQARRHLAEVYFKMKEFEKGLAVLRVALVKEQDLEEKARIGLRVVDVLLNDLKDARTATEEVNYLSRTFKGTSLERRVQHSIERMRREKIRDLLS